LVLALVKPSEEVLADGKLEVYGKALCVMAGAATCDLIAHVSRSAMNWKRLHGREATKAATKAPEDRKSPKSCAWFGHSLRIAFSTQGFIV